MRKRHVRFARKSRTNIILRPLRSWHIALLRQPRVGSKRAWGGGGGRRGRRLTLLFLPPSSNFAAFTPPYLARFPRCILIMSHSLRNSTLLLYSPQNLSADTAHPWYSLSSFEFDLSMSRTARYTSHRNLSAGKSIAVSRCARWGSADMVDRSIDWGRLPSYSSTSSSSSTTTSPPTVAAADDDAAAGGCWGGPRGGDAASPASTASLASRHFFSAFSTRWRITPSRLPGAWLWLRLRYWCNPSFASRALLRSRHRSR